MALTWRTRSLVVGLCAFSVITTLVNKHVLSDLRFTYPTVFQSWQTGTVALVLLSLNALGYIELTFLPVTSPTLASWLPASVLFSGMIYSGSVALSRLLVPVFCGMCYLQNLFVALLESFILKKEPSTNSQFSLIFTAIATVSVAGTDVQFDQMGYKWLMIHCGLSGTD
ncbi:transmembrane protein 241-like isoform X2 [Stylophora pistillata]|uniref:transmembrane protein 241-like isoform X2 n=1 Tax=Stylophora pistillata TaxID=50429 RepID=UPI000C03E972|nr:transmembrane protein 241-like isoform X2 [Stylophora pistillata]